MQRCFGPFRSGETLACVLAGLLAGEMRVRIFPSLSTTRNPFPRLSKMYRLPRESIATARGARASEAACDSVPPQLRNPLSFVLTNVGITRAVERDTKGLYQRKVRPNLLQSGREA
jgi:hypothetical protein